MRPRGFSSGPFGVIALLFVAVTAVAVSAASPQVGLGRRDELTALQATQCPPVGDDGKVPARAGDAKVSGGKNSDWLMAKWHWDDLKGHDLTVEKWCINATPDFEPYFSLRVIQSEYKIEHGMHRDHKDRDVVLPGVPTPTPSPTATPSPTPTPSVTPEPIDSSSGRTRTRPVQSPSPSPPPPHAGTC